MEHYVICSVLWLHLRQPCALFVLYSETSGRTNIQNSWKNYSFSLFWSSGFYASRWEYKRLWTEWL